MKTRERDRLSERLQRIARKMLDVYDTLIDNIPNEDDRDHWTNECDKHIIRSYEVLDLILDHIPREKGE